MDGGDQGLLRGGWETDKGAEGELVPGMMGNSGAGIERKADITFSLMGRVY